MEVIDINLIDDDPITDVRLGPKQKGESQAIKELAESFTNDGGQLQPITVRGTSGGRYSVITGHRRLAAAKSLGWEGIHAIVTDSDDDLAFRQAVAENLKRKNFTPLQVALLIGRIRKEHDWNGTEGTPSVADYLGVSRATVTEHEKLLSQPKDIQNQVHTGEMSFAAAQLLWQNVTEDQTEPVAARAKEIAKQEESQKSPAAKKQAAKKAKQTGGTAPAGQVQRKHVEKAAKELGAEKTVTARGRGQLLEPFEMILEAADGFSSEVVVFCKYYVKTYATGGGTANGVVAKWSLIDEIVDDKKTKAAQKAAKQQTVAAGKKQEAAA